MTLGPLTKEQFFLEIKFQGLICLRVHHGHKSQNMLSIVVYYLSKITRARIIHLICA